MQPNQSIEAGIIKTFRLFTGVRLAMFVFSLAVYYRISDWAALNNLPLIEFMLADNVLLLAYLWLPGVERYLKRAYLPVGIIWATIGPILQMHLVFLLISDPSVERGVFPWLLQTLLVLFIPLVITGWRYTMKAVLIYCGLALLFDVFLLLISYRFFGASYFPQVLAIAYVRTIIFLLVGNMIANLVKVQREQNLRLARANEQLSQYATALEQLTISCERNRMARELHDVLAHTMSGVAVELEGVRAMLRVDPDQAEGLLSQSLQAVREGLTETRRALQALRAAPLEDLGLGRAIRNLAESIAGRAGLQTDLQIENDMPDFPLDVQQGFYRVAQEALTNIVTHSQASKVQLCMRREGSILKLSIQDDGVGFDESTIDLNEKYGLLGMRERVEMINGHLSIVSQAGSGTQILLTCEVGRSITKPTEAPNA
jgi:signal transduction histidine kinase